jgi:hypothetical protein
MVISLNVESATHEGEVAAVDALRAELEARGVAVKDDRWGFRRPAQATHVFSRVDALWRGETRTLRGTLIARHAPLVLKTSGASA